jgi:hypothetical protein
MTYEDYQVQSKDTQIAKLLAELLEKQKDVSGNREEIADLRGRIQFLEAEKIRLIEAERIRLIEERTVAAAREILANNQVVEALHAANQANHRTIEASSIAAAAMNQLSEVQALADRARIVADESIRAVSVAVEASRTSQAAYEEMRVHASNRDNVLLYGAGGAGVGAGVSILVHVCITGISPLLAITLIFAGAIGGAMYGNNK